MIQIVHWKNYIPPEFMGDFERIEKKIANAKRFDGMNQAEAEIAKHEPDNYRTWKTCRWKMRHAGYELLCVIKGENKWTERGWYGTAEIVKSAEGEELKFRYAANSAEKPVYITVAQLMQLKQEMGQDAVEESYYKPTAGIYTNALSKKFNKRLDINKSFIPEEEDAHDF